MAYIQWLEPVNGRFRVAADWSGGIVPGESDIAVLNAVGANFTVTARASETVDEIRLNAYATLDIVGGNFTAIDGTGLGRNAGSIVVGNGTTFTVGGNLTNAGVILFKGDIPSTNLVLASNTTLSGGGTVTLDLGGNIRDEIEVEAATGAGNVILTNVNNTITGGGDIAATNSDSQSLTLVNQSKGVIDGGIGDEALSFGSNEVRNFILNRGLIEAGGDYNPANLTINDTRISGVGGKINANTEANIQLNDCLVVGQVLSTETIGYISILQGSSVTLAGTLQNAGEIVLSGSNLTLENGGALSGGGVVSMGAEAGVRAVVSGTSSSIVLTNIDNTISGSGDLGDGKLTLVNEVGGTIDGGVAQQALVIDTGKNTIINDGLIETTPYANLGDGGDVIIRGAIANNGLIAANDTTITVDGAVTGSGQATVASGTLDFKSGFDQNVTFTGAGFLILAHSQAYTAAITGFFAVDLRDIGFVSAGEASFSGTTNSGVLTVSDGPHTANITLIGDYTGSTFVASSDGHGGVTIVGPPAVAPTTHQFVAAMADLSASAVAMIHFGDARSSAPTMLTGPRAAIV
jgi:hypothetical protein